MRKARVSRLALVGVSLGLAAAGCRAHFAAPPPIALPPSAPVVSAMARLRVGPPQERIEAALELGAIGPAAEGVLLAALTDPEPQVREHAPIALAAMCSRASIPGLIALTDDPSAQVRNNAVPALGVLGGDEALRAVTGALRHPNPWDRVVAYMTLCDTGRPALPHLEASIAGREPRRLLAAAALVCIGDPASAATFRALLEDPDDQVREQALVGLARIGDRNAVAALFAQLETDVHSVARSKIPGHLSRVPGTAFAAVLDELRSGHAGRRLGAAMAISLMPAPDSRVESLVARPLLDALSLERDTTVRAELVVALGVFRSRPVLEALAGLLADPDPLVRMRAVDALAGAGAPPLEMILVALADRNPQVRASAAVLLIKLRDPRSVPSLIAATRDGDAGVRQYAVEALGAIGDSSAVDAIEVAASDPDALVRQAAVRAAGTVGPAGAEVVLAALERGEPSNYTEWIDGFLSLGELRADQDARAAKALLQAFAAQPHLGEKLYLALGKLGILPLEPLLAAARMPGGGREYAIAALGYLQGPRVVPALIELLPGAQAQDRVAVWGALERQGAPAVDSLIAALLDERPAVRLGAASALGGIGDSRAADTLLAIARDRDAEVRLGVLFALGKLRDPRAVPYIIQGLLAPDSRLQGVAIRACRGQRSPLLAETLAIVLPELRDSSRREALESLASMDRAATATLIALARHADAGVRRFAVETLTRTRPPEALPALVAALADSDAPVREAAAAGLGALGDNRAVEPLSRSLTDRDPGVRRAAAAALARIGVADPAFLAAALGHPDVEVRGAARRILDDAGDVIPDVYWVPDWAKRRCGPR